MTLELLHAELDEITDEKTEAVLLVTVQRDGVMARIFGAEHMIKSAMLEILDDLDNEELQPEAYAH